MNIGSHVTKSERGGKLHVTRGTAPKSVIGNHNGVVIMVEGDDGRTYRVELWADDLRRIAEQSYEAMAAV